MNPSCGLTEAKTPPSDRLVAFVEARFATESRTTPTSDRCSTRCQFGLEHGSVFEWIDRIATTWARGAVGTLELARLVAKARDDLEYGEWSRLWGSGEIPFSKRKGEMLVVIGKGVGGLDAQNSAHLPVAWTTLYYLARLGPSLITRLIDEGRVHSDLSLHEAQTLVAAHRPGTSRRKARPGIKARLSRLAQFVRVSLLGWSAAERRLVRIELLRLADQVALNDRSYQPRKS